MYPTNLDNIPTNWANQGDTLTDIVLLYPSASPSIVYVDQPIKSLKGISGYTQVNSTPAAGQYRVYWNTNQIQFGPIPFPTSTAITYITLGTVFDATHINDMASAINNMEATLGLNPQGSYPTIGAYLTALAAGSGAGNLIRIEQFVASSPSGSYQVTLTYSPSSSVALVFRDSEMLNPFSVGATPAEFTMTGNNVNIDPIVNLEDQELITVIYFSL